MNTDEMQSVMDDAERAAIYWKTLVRNGVDPVSATSMAGMWACTWVRVMTDEPPHRPEPWDEP